MSSETAQAPPGAPIPGAGGPMRSARIAGPRRTELVVGPRPEPGAGEVRVWLEGCGICGEPLGCAATVFARARIGAGDTVAIVGGDFVGAVTLALAVSAGATVIAVASRASARHLAIKLGAMAALSSVGDVAGAVWRLTAGGLCDVAVDAAGLPRTLELCGSLTRSRGRVVVAGCRQGDPCGADTRRWASRGLRLVRGDGSDRAEDAAGVRAAVAAVRDGRIPLRRLITHRRPLERIDEAFWLAAERPAGFLKAVVTR